MTVADDLIKKKTDLQNKIKDDFVAFEKDTGLIISCIDVKRQFDEAYWKGMSKTKGPIVDTDISVRLTDTKVT